MNDSGDYQQLLQELDIEKSDEGEEIKKPEKEEEVKDTKVPTPVLDDDSEDEITKIVGKDVLNDAQPEIKKTEKIISNQPVDKDEFSYFKKAKAADNKPKVELDDDLDLFDQGDKKKTMASINQPKEDDFDFEF